MKKTRPFAKVFLLSLFLALFVSNTSAQKVTLSFQNETFEKVLNSIKQQTGLSLVFSEQLVNLNRKVTIDVNSISVEDALKQLLIGTGLGYEIKNNKLYLVENKSTEQKSTFIQSKKLTGLVTDEKGDPIIGATVIVKGTTTGTITDVNGKFVVEANSQDVIQFSYIGFERLEQKVGNAAQLSVRMIEDTKALDEVVVVGYGVQKKRDVIGSVVTVKADELTKSSNSDAISNLQGKASGLNIISSAGGSKVMLRGVHSINSGNDPLWVVDGIPSDPPSTEEIASIEILKDASATAIYGSRGSNGVIIVTTKKGKEGKSDLNFNISSGYSFASKTPTDMGIANNVRWFEIMDQATANSNVSLFDPMVVMNMDVRYKTTDITAEEARAVRSNWFNELTKKPGNYLQASMSLTTGTKTGSTFFNASYRKSDQTIPGNNDQALTVRINSDYNILENLTIGAKVNFTKSGGMNNGGRYTNYLPWKPLYNDDDPDRTIYWNPHGNPLTSLDTKYRQYRTDYARFLGGVYAELKLPFIKGLALRTEYNQNFYVYGTTDWQSGIVRPAISDSAGNYADEQSTTGTRFNSSSYFKYGNTFGKNAVNAVAGFEVERGTGYYRQASAQNLISPYPQLGSSQGVRLSTQGFVNTEDYLMSFFGRADYKFDDKILFGVSLRTDGSSLFDSKYRWGLFSALSAGWIISEEKFMKQFDWIDMLKLRGSYGQTGNKNIPSNVNLTTYKTNSIYAYGEYNTTQQGGSKPLTIGNRSLTWETTSSYDLGIDYTLLKNKLSGSLAYYFQDVNGLVLAASVPQSTGLTGDNQVWGNLGRLYNSGLEFNISSVNVHTKDFEWTTDFNISTSKNRVVELTYELDSKGLPIYHDQNMVDGLVSRKGGMVREYYMPEYAGVDPEKGVDMIYELDYENFKATGNTNKTGRLIPATDGNLQKNRFVMSGKSISPTYYGGISNTLKFKQLDLNLLVTYSGGNYIYDQAMALLSSPQKGTSNLYANLVEKSWKNSGDIAEYPRLVYGNTQPFGWNPDVVNPASPTGKGDWTNTPGSYIVDNGSYSKYLYKGDFLKIKHLEIGYSVAESVLKKNKIKKIRLFFAADNLKTFTAYPGWDPESAIARGGILGTNYNNFNPFLVEATFYGGIQLNF